MREDNKSGVSGVVEFIWKKKAETVFIRAEAN